MMWYVWDVRVGCLCVCEYVCVGAMCGYCLIYMLWGCVFVYVRSVCVVINGVACCGVYYVINCCYKLGGMLRGFICLIINRYVVWIVCCCVCVVCAYWGVRHDCDG